MCGIAGIIKAEAHHGEELYAMLETQKHRGPDHTGVWIENKAALGHNRLSIIDLSSHANQPFKSSCGNYVLVFNGEIYNYLELKKELKDYDFQTNSDTEVLLAAYIKWGSDCLHRLNGMFAFAVWNIANEELFAARDRFGVKPLYYYTNDNGLYFASEIKALHQTNLKKQLNSKVWASYMMYGSYGMPNETFWKDVEQLPGGHFFTYKQGELCVKKWYCFEDEVKKNTQQVSFDEVKKQYETLLKDSISLRFRADVPVGFNISGGLDSSTLLAYVNKTKGKENINAYTFYTNDERYDELPWVEEMMEHTQNPLKKVLLKNDSSLIENMKELTKMQDEPYGGIPTIAYANIFKQARKDEVLVLLDGQGMDEQWAGYDYYTQNNNAVIQGMNKSPFKTHVFSEEFKSQAIKPEYPKLFDDEVLNKQYRDLFYTKIPRALRFNDRVSMAYSTELREPFLDYRLVEYAFAQPLDYKIKNGVQKYLLRALVSSSLSDKISYAPKRPLQTPQREWLGKELVHFVEEQIEFLKVSEVAHWFNFVALEKEWNAYKNGNQESSFHIWQWINLAMLIA